MSNAITLSEFRNQILQWLIAGYLILNYGFMQLRFPPNSIGVPIAELSILFFLLTIHYPSMTPRLSIVFPITLLVCWWIYIFIRAAMGYSSFGLWAFRDATNVIESLFLIGGFIFAQHPENIKKFFNWLPKILFIGCTYALTFPIGNIIQSISPKIVSGSGQMVSIIGMYTNSSLLLIWAAVFILIFSSKEQKTILKKYLLSTFLIGFALLLFQARTVYLQILAIFFIFFIYRRDLINKLFIGLILCLVFVSLLPFFEIVFSGRIRQTVSIDFLIKHFWAIFGTSSEGLEQAAKGVSQRTDWWSSIYYRLSDSWYNLFLGLGYGFPLIDFHITGNVPVREPHNSYLSFIARSGLIGLAFFLWVHLLLVRAWHKTYKTCLKLKWDLGANRLIILLVYFVLVWVYAIGEDAFEKPYNTVPYYFFWGIVLRFSNHLNSGEIGPDKIST